MLRALLIIFSISVLTSCLRTDVKEVVRYTPFLNVDNSSADSILQQMTLPEKVGQLIVLKSDLKNRDSKVAIKEWTKQGYIGGVMLEDLEVSRFVHLIDSLNGLSKIPLLNGTVQSVLLNNQFSDAVQFPLPPSIGAIQNDTLQKELEALYIKQCKALGINFCITPSTNSIQLSDKKYQTHLFENDPKRKLERASRVLENLQKEQILSLGNSFSEFYIMENDSLGRLDSLLANQLFLAQKGVSGFFIDKSIFEVDSLQKLQTFFLKQYLKNHLEFDGLMIGEISKETAVDELIHAGTDLIIVRDSAKAVFDYLYQFVKDGLMSEKVLDAKVKKILLAKTYAGLDGENKKKNLSEAGRVLKNEHYKFFARQLFEHSITLAQNYNNLLPYSKTYKRDFRIINVGDEKLNVFKDYFSKYANFQIYNHRPDAEGKIKSLKTIFHKHSTSVVVLDQIDLDTFQHFDFVNSVNELSQSAKLTVVNYGNPLNLQYFDSTMTLIQVFEKNKVTESIVPQLLFGGTSVKGKLPIALSPSLPYGKSIATKITRLKYTVPQEVGIAPEKLVSIDAIMQSAISRRATPGGQVLVVKDGKVFYEKAFGHHTYDRKQAVRKADLYDLASITKVAATSLASMKLFEKGEFNIQDRVKDHFKLSDDATIGRVTFKQLLTHSSGLQSNIPISQFYLNKDTLVGNCNQYFCKKPDNEYSIQVANEMYLNPRWLDSLWKKVEHLKIKRRGRFRYSDVNFYLMQRFIENKSNQPLNDYVNNNFYKSLNMRRTAFRPLEKFKPKYLVPTENDKRWREQILRGYVHDESAALLGGVAGSSGLFSNANDLAILFQMLLNEGTYGDQKFLKPNTVKKFTTANYGNHRGLGFVVKGRRGANSLSSQASRKTYGHTGFSGTCVWADPENGLIYIFLSNRIHPKKNNTKLYRKQVRRRIHDVIYKALDSYDAGATSTETIFVDM